MSSGGLQVRTRVRDALKALRPRMKRGAVTMTPDDEADLRFYLKEQWGFDPDPSAAHLRAILLTTWRALNPKPPGQKRKWDSKTHAELGRDYFEVRRKYPDTKRVGGDKRALNKLKTEPPWNQRYGGVSEAQLGRELRRVFSLMRYHKLLPKLITNADVKERLLKWDRRGKKFVY
jgi:hypothetical protein